MTKLVLNVYEDRDEDEDKNKSEYEDEEKKKKKKKRKKKKKNTNEKKKKEPTHICVRQCCNTQTSETKTEKQIDGETKTTTMTMR